MQAPAIPVASVGVSAQPAVLCRGITKFFGKGDAQVMALRGIDLTVNLGEIMMLVGPSGCGKTTLISIIASILKTDGGNCEVLGTDMQGLTSAQATAFRAKHIGFIFQSYQLLPALTITENVAVPLIINGVSRREALARAGALLNELGLGNRLGTRPGSLSGGQQQRVAIARALVHEPELLVCDEPTSALDHATGGRIMELMTRAARERHTTLVIITHDNRILDFADRIAHMDDGMIVPEHAIEH